MREPCLGRPNGLAWTQWYHGLTSNRRETTLGLYFVVWGYRSPNYAEAPPQSKSQKPNLQQRQVGDFNLEKTLVLAMFRTSPDYYVCMYISSNNSSSNNKSKLSTKSSAFQNNVLKTRDSKTIRDVQQHLSARKHQ